MVVLQRLQVLTTYQMLAPLALVLYLKDLLNPFRGARRILLLRDIVEAI